MPVYLDANASEPPRPEALAAAGRALALTGNPASVHGPGRAARALLESARETLAGLLGARPGEVVFTSGATEANALALHALPAGRRVLVGATEHDSVLAAAAGAPRLPVGQDGVIDLDAAAAALAGGPAFVAVMAANNETGTIQPLAALAALCRRHGAWLHVDAVQGLGRGPIPPGDSLAISGHKLGGPPGAGALVLRGAIGAPRPLLAGGGQERGWRAGTPPLAAIAGLAAAAAAAFAAGDAEAARLGLLRDRIAAAAAAAGAVVLAAGAPRLTNTACLALPGVRADAQVIALDLAGIAVSAGAACSSGKVAPSHVLAAMGQGALAGQAIRVSLPWNATAAEAEAFIAAYPAIAARLAAALRGPAACSTPAPAPHPAAA
ncbi:MAG: cysteine desulfurase family protein [Acetobacteraceae bacterium]